MAKRLTLDVRNYLSALGKRGGPARAKALSAERRREIGRMGGAATRAMFAKRKGLTEKLT